jgi:hypothetical protein
MVTGVPIGISRKSLMIAGLRMRTQPCETCPGRMLGWFVPWMPMNPPPGQSESFVERAFSPKARGP